MNNKISNGFSIKTGIKAGGLASNHNRGLKVASNVRAAGLGTSNHNRGLRTV